MLVRKLSPTGDMTFGQSLKDFWSDVPEAPGQVAQTSLELWLGEWYIDITQGTPWIEGVLGKHSQAMADATVQTQILNTQGVTGIASFQSTIDPDTRAYSVTATINTVYGPTDVQIQNYANF